MPFHKKNEEDCLAVFDWYSSIYPVSIFKEKANNY